MLFRVKSKIVKIEKEEVLTTIYEYGNYCTPCNCFLMGCSSNPLAYPFDTSSSNKNTNLSFKIFKHSFSFHF